MTVMGTDREPTIFKTLTQINLFFKFFEIGFIQSCLFALSEDYAKHIRHKSQNFDLM